MTHSWRKWRKVALAAMLLATTGAAQAIEVAGDLFVDLSASHGSAGGSAWTNAGTLGDFTEVGDPRLLTIAGGVQAVVFDGIDDAYVSSVLAPAGITGVDPTRTIEAWVLNPSIASEETIVSWGKRGGPDGSNIAFNYGNHGTYGAVGHWGGADIGWIDGSTAGAPAALQWHHLVYSYDGTTTRVYVDGALANSETLTPGAINTHADTKIAVASQWESDATTLTGGLKGSMAIARLRIHDGVLSDSQVNANYVAEAASFTNPPAPHTPVPQPLSGGPKHRYSFSNPPAMDASAGVLTDSVSGANGVVQGAGAQFTGTRLRLPGGPSDTAAYGDLPNGLVSSLVDVTIEGWAGIEGSQNWQRLFDFGSNEPGGDNGEITGPGETNGGGAAGLDYIALTANRGDNVNQQRLEIRNEDPAGGGVMTLDADAVTPLPSDVHFAVTYDADGGLFGEPLVRYYRNGQLQAEGSTNTKLSDIKDVNNWLGRSNWTGDANFQGTYDEFRIYDRALSADEVLGNTQAGADVVNVVPEPASLTLAALMGLSVAHGLRRRRR